MLLNNIDKILENMKKYFDDFFKINPVPKSFVILGNITPDDPQTTDGKFAIWESTTDYELHRMKDREVSKSMHSAYETHISTCYDYYGHNINNDYVLTEKYDKYDYSLESDDDVSSTLFSMYLMMGDDFSYHDIFSVIIKYLFHKYYIPNFMSNIDMKQLIIENVYANSEPWYKKEFFNEF